MSLCKQAKILNKTQVGAIHAFLRTKRNALRNQTVFLLSVKAGLRAKEIENLKWSMLLDADGELSSCIHLQDVASKGNSGRVIPLNAQLRSHLVKLLNQERSQRRFDQSTGFVAQIVLCRIHCVNPA